MKTEKKPRKNEKSPEPIRTTEFFKDGHLVAPVHLPYELEDIPLYIHRKMVPLYTKLMKDWKRLVYVVSLLIKHEVPFDDLYWDSGCLVMTVFNYLYCRNPYAQPYDARNIYRQIKIALLTGGIEKWKEQWCEQLQAMGVNTEDDMNDLEDKARFKRNPAPKNLYANQRIFSVD